MKIENENNYEQIEDKLAKSLAKRITGNLADIDKVYREAALADVYKDIISQTINKYNYNGKNFNPMYLPIILSMALKEHDSQSIRDTAWNNLTPERPSPTTENSILSENLDIVYKYMKNLFDDRDKEDKSQWSIGYDEGFSMALTVLKAKIDEMTKVTTMTAEEAVENKMKQLSERAEGGYVRLE